MEESADTENSRTVVAADCRGKKIVADLDSSDVKLRFTLNYIKRTQQNMLKVISKG